MKAPGTHFLGLCWLHSGAQCDLLPKREMHSSPTEKPSRNKPEPHAPSGPTVRTESKGLPRSLPEPQARPVLMAPRDTPLQWMFPEEGQRAPQCEKLKKLAL